MLLQPKQNLEERIVQILARMGQTTASGLSETISNEGRAYSRQGIYKELRKLQETGVVVKHGKFYSLSLIWILNLTDLADSMFESFVGEEVSLDHLPAAGKKVSWQFSRLSKLDNLAIHLMLLLFQNTESKEMFQWLPHPWFELIHHEKELQLEQALKVGGYQVHVIIGGENYLDTLFTSEWPYNYSHAVGPFERERSHYYCVIDQYILTWILDTETTQRIDTLFETVTGPEDLQVSAIMKAVQSAGNYSIRIENNLKKATSMINQFREYFGEKALQVP